MHLDLTGDFKEQGIFNLCRQTGFSFFEYWCGHTGDMHFLDIGRIKTFV